PFPGDGGESAGPAREPATAWTAAASTAQRERGGKLVPAVARVPLGVLIPSVPFSSLIPSVPFSWTDAQRGRAERTLVEIPPRCGSHRRSRSGTVTFRESWLPGSASLRPAPASSAPDRQADGRCCACARRATAAPPRPLAGAAA